MPSRPSRANVSTPRDTSRVDQERRRARLEPVRAELAPVEQQQDVERVVDRLGIHPPVAVVPVADRVTVEAGQLRSEDRVQIRVGIAAEGAVARVQRDVYQVVEAGKQTDLREPAHPGQQREPDVRVAGLDGAVQAAQKVAVGAGCVRRLERVEDRLVVLVHQHHDPLSALLVERLDQSCQSAGKRCVGAGESGPPFGGRHLIRDLRRQGVRSGEVAAAEVEPQHRMTHRPVPVVMDGQTFEQRPVAFEELLQRIHQQALPEAPGARQEKVLARVDEPPQPGGLVHVVVAARPNLAEGLDPDRQLEPPSCPPAGGSRPVR